MVNIKEKEDSFMEEMRTKEKQIVYDQALYEKPMNLQKRNMEPRKESVEIRISRTRWR